MYVELKISRDHLGFLLLYQAKQGAVPQRHMHRELELNYVRQGHATYLVGNRSYRIGPGTLIWLFPEPSHHLVSISPDFEAWIAVFRPTFVAEHCPPDSNRHWLTATKPEGGHLRQVPDPISSYFDTLCERIAQTERCSLDLNTGLAYLLSEASHCYDTSTTSPSGTHLHPSVEKAAFLLKQTACEDPSLSEVAQRVGLSDPQLSRLFKQQLKVSFLDYRNEQKVQAFLDIYGAGKRLTMLEASLEAGFGSYAQFHRVFSKVMTCSPSAYFAKEAR